MLTYIVRRVLDYLLEGIGLPVAVPEHFVYLRVGSLTKFVQYLEVLNGGGLRNLLLHF
jgi:hypothetical protein